jgi:hypothetical protein
MFIFCNSLGPRHSDRDVVVGGREGRDPDREGSLEGRDRLRRHRRIRTSGRHHQLRIQKRGQGCYQVRLLSLAFL